jgi:beta-lactam-binding protein with PASTA domain
VRVSFAKVQDSGQIQRVISQQPAAGTTVPEGSTVTVVIGSRRAAGG